MAEERGKTIADAIASQENLGPTGVFPRQQLNARDKGQLKLAVVSDHASGTVVLSFGTSLTWLGMSADDADNLAHVLRERAASLRDRAAKAERQAEKET